MNKKSNPFSYYFRNIFESLTSAKKSFFHVTSKASRLLEKSFISDTQVRFSQVFAAVVLEENSFLPMHVDDKWEYVNVFDRQLYMQGR